MLEALGDACSFTMYDNVLVARAASVTSGLPFPTPKGVYFLSCTTRACTGPMAVGGA